MMKQHMVITRTLFFSFFMCLFLVNVATAFAAEAPLITTAELKKKMDAGEAFVLADALSSIEHNELSIKGAVNIPSTKVKGNNNLPPDKNTPLIFYCLGPKCGKSKIAAAVAMELGYTNVMVYNEGLPEWAKNKYPVEKKANYPSVDVPRLTPQQLADTASSVVILDIRDSKHQESGHIAGAVEIDMDDLDSKYTQLPKDKKIVVIDHAAKQVVVAAKFLHMNGYQNLAVLDGGVLAWIGAGLPVTK